MAIHAAKITIVPKHVSLLTFRVKYSRFDTLLLKVLRMVFAVS
jgi:hypothetical protein